MKKYKGYNVPDVGGFVSDYSLHVHDEVVSNNYCDNAIEDDCLLGLGKCKKCLFNEPVKEFQEWHNARLKELS